MMLPAVGNGVSEPDPPPFLNTSPPKRNKKLPQRTIRNDGARYGTMRVQVLCWYEI